jgi:hypothetical protein
MINGHERVRESDMIWVLGLLCRLRGREGPEIAAGGA